MIARILSISPGRPPVVLVDSALGQFRAYWCGDEDPRQDTYEVELAIPGTLKWGEQLKLSTGTHEDPRFELGPDGTKMRGTLVSLSRDDVARISFGIGSLVVSTSGDLPAQWKDATVTVTTDELEIYDSNY